MPKQTIFASISRFTRTIGRLFGVRFDRRAEVIVQLPPYAFR